MKLCAGQCKYLLTLYNLSQNHNIVRSIDIANALSVTRPSVSRMLKCMVRMELIDPDYSTSVVMTEKGKENAEKLMKNFIEVNAFFRNILKLEEEAAFEQSIQFLSYFPEQTVSRIASVTRSTLAKRSLNSENK